MKRNQTVAANMSSWIADMGLFENMTVSLTSAKVVTHIYRDVTSAVQILISNKIN